MGLDRFHHPGHSALPDPGPHHRLDLQLVESVYTAGHSEPPHRSHHEPSLALARSGPPNAACQPIHADHYQLSCAGRQSSTGTHGCPAILAAGPANCGAVVVYGSLASRAALHLPRLALQYDCFRRSPSARDQLTAGFRLNRTDVKSKTMRMDTGEFWNTAANLAWQSYPNYFRVPKKLTHNPSHFRSTKCASLWTLAKSNSKE